jgi:hypothetical protein
MEIKSTTLPKLKIDAGRDPFITRRLWQASEKFRGDLNRLITQECVALNVDEQTNFIT